MSQSQSFASTSENPPRDPFAVFDVPHHKENDFFVILGVTQTSTAEEIRQKYNELLLIYHPDKGGDPQKFADLKKAYKILSDPQKREIYTKSLAATYSDITKEYRTSEGKIKDLGYDISQEDFAKGDDASSSKRRAFFNKFEESRSADEKKIMEELKLCDKQEKTFDQLMKERDLQDESGELEIPKILDPKEFNSDVFNQIFETMKEKNSRELEPMGVIKGFGTMGLAPVDNQLGYGSMFANDSWTDYTSYKQQQDFQTYQRPIGVDPKKFSSSVNVTKTRDLNPENLQDLYLQRIQEHKEARDQLLFMDETQYQLDPEHDPRKNPLSALNMLVTDRELAKLTLDPPPKTQIKRNRMKGGQ